MQCTRGPQSLSSLRAQRDHDPALLIYLYAVDSKKYLTHKKLFQTCTIIIHTVIFPKIFILIG